MTLIKLTSTPYFSSTLTVFSPLPHKHALTIWKEILAKTPMPAPKSTAKANEGSRKKRPKQSVIQLNLNVDMLE